MPLSMLIYKWNSSTLKMATMTKKCVCIERQAYEAFSCGKMHCMNNVEHCCTAVYANRLHDITRVAILKALTLTVLENSQQNMISMHTQAERRKKKTQAQNSFGIL